jgi:RNA 3'-terminal phosphate cyclase (ATP)
LKSVDPAGIESTIRANRARGGLRLQHLCAVNAAATISGAATDGATVGSSELVFRPNAVRSGEYAFAIGSAGSTTLVLQTVLFPLLLAGDRPSTVRFEGGTHNPLAPPFEFLERAFLPEGWRMGGRVEMKLERYGFYPAGGGCLSVTIQPTHALDELVLLERLTQWRPCSVGFSRGLSLSCADF